MTNISRNWLEKAKIYKIFAKGITELDFSNKSACDMYEYETFGQGNLGSNIFDNTDNGFFWGKQRMDVTLKMWVQGIKEGLLTKAELFADSKFPNKWLKEVLKNVFMTKKGEANRYELMKPRKE